MSGRGTAFDSRIAAPWARAGDRQFWLAGSSWSMAALAEAAADRLGRATNVWLPEYFCGASMWPLRQTRSALHFYPIDEQGRPDWANLDRAGQRPDMFFLVHYFGHANDHAEARQFCDDSRALLVEDAAHVLGPVPGIGDAGDIVLYSPHKFFPAPNGGLMLIRPRAEQWVAPVSRATAGLGESTAMGLRWMAQAGRAKVSAFPPRKSRATWSEAMFFSDPLPTPVPARTRPSPVSRSVFASVDLEETARRRSANDAAVRAYFKGRPGWRPLFATPSPAPLRSVFRLDSPERASAAFAALRNAGVEAQCWPPLSPPEVRDRGTIAALLRRTLICIPCHQGLTPNVIVDALKEADMP